MSTGTVAAVVAGVAVVAGGVAVSTNEDAGCIKSPLAVVVDLNDLTHAEIIAHASRAPRLLHLARDLARRHRSLALQGWPPRAGYDRDEYPPASTQEGGIGSDIRYIDSHENRSAGAVMGRQLSPYCDGQAFMMEAK